MTACRDESSCRQILHSADQVLDKMAELTDGQPLPAAAKGLCRLLFEITFSSFKTIQVIEQNIRNSLHPS